MAVLDVVYFSSNDTVDKADASITAKARPVGVVESKPTTTTCKVVQIGVVAGYAGLTAGGSVWLSPTTPGGITQTALGTPGHTSVIVGEAKSATAIAVRLEPRRDL